MHCSCHITFVTQLKSLAESDTVLYDCHTVDCVLNDLKRDKGKNNSKAGLGLGVK